MQVCGILSAGSELYYPNTGSAHPPLLLMDYSPSVRWELKIGGLARLEAKHFEEIKLEVELRVLIWRQGAQNWRGLACLEAKHFEEISSSSTWRLGALI